MHVKKKLGTTKWSWSLFLWELNLKRNMWHSANSKLAWEIRYKAKSDIFSCVTVSCAAWGCPRWASETDDCLDKEIPSGAPSTPRALMTKEQGLHQWHPTFTQFWKEKERKKKNTYKFLLIQVKGPNHESGAALRDEGHQRLTRGTLAVGGWERSRAGAQQTT